MALVQIFNPFPEHPNRETGLFCIKRARGQQTWLAKIVPLSDLHFPCHISPIYTGTHIPDDWIDPTKDLMDKPIGTVYALNPFSTVLFHAMLFGAGCSPMARPTQAPISAQPDESPVIVPEQHDTQGLMANHADPAATLTRRTATRLQSRRMANQPQGSRKRRRINRLKTGTGVENW